MSVVYIVVEIPWLACEPGDAYEEETAVSILKVFLDKEKANLFARDYVTKYLKSSPEYGIIKKYVTEGYLGSQTSIWVNFNHKKVENFNEVNGFAVVVYPKAVE